MEKYQRTQLEIAKKEMTSMEDKKALEERMMSIRTMKPNN
jgi:hypothetical protein